MTNDFDSLLKNYNALQLENTQLKEEIKQLRYQIGIEVEQPEGTIEPRETTAILKNIGATLLFKPSIHQKFAIIDQKIVGYGSINLLSFGTSEESMMRLASTNIAYELLKSVEAKA
jgi:phosphatidylserine/phosphatidylglycerophosphate/cardiolipin synthase-like enzyme